MVNKIMKVFYAENCLPYKDPERSVLYPIVGGAFMGASNTTEVRFYIDKIGGIDSSWVCTSKLPNGKRGEQLLTTGYDSELEENYVILHLTSFYTQAKGELYLTLIGYEGDIQLELDSETGLYTLVGTPIIEATGSVKINIAYATLITGSDEMQYITLQDILALVGDKMNKDTPNVLKVVDSIANINTAQYNEYLVADNVVLDSSTFKVYEISGTFPNLIATFVMDLNENGIFALDSISNGTTLTNEQLFEALKKASVCVYNKIVFQKLMGGAYMTFAQEWVIEDNNGVLTHSRTTFKINSSTGVISDSHLETYQTYDLGELNTLLGTKANASDVYTKTQADNKFQQKLTAGFGIVIDGNVISSNVPVLSISDSEIDDIWGE